MAHCKKFPFGHREAGAKVSWAQTSKIYRVPTRENPPWRLAQESVDHEFNQKIYPSRFVYPSSTSPLLRSDEEMLAEKHDFLG